MRIFITGGTGFIGRQAVRLLAEHNECMVLTRQQMPSTGALRYATGELGDRERVRAIIKEFEPDTLLHLAWDVAAADFAASRDNEKWVEWSKNLAEDFLLCGGRNVIASGTCFEYEWRDDAILTEQSNIHPATLYGECKARTYNAIQDLCVKYGGRFAWGRVFYPYGRGEARRKLVRHAIDTLRSGKQFTCGIPMSRIDYIHVIDVASSFALLTTSSLAHGAYNICTGRTVQVGDMLRYVARKLGRENKLHLCTQDHPLCVAGDNSAILRAGVSMQYTDIYRGLDTYFD